MGGLPTFVTGRGLIGMAARETLKLELNRARFKAGWGWAARGHDGEVVDTLN